MSRLPVAGQVERLRLVGDLSRDETALAVVADAGPACPAHRDAAGLSEFQHAFVCRRIPVGGYAAARERDEGTGFKVDRWPMRVFVTAQLRAASTARRR
jgi:hypothetical protein